ncbi:hypothetical protein ACOYR1_09280 [Thalassotalea piscium]
MKHLPLIITTLLLSNPIHSVLADVYKCEIDGKTTFSQFPCADNAEKITIKEVQPVQTPPTINYQAHNKEINDVNDYIELSQIKREINQHQSKIKSYKNKMTQEIKVLEIRARSANNNLAGATYEHALTTQMTAVTNKYNTLIEVEQNKINRLEAKMNQATTTTQATLPDIDTYISDKKTARNKKVISNKIARYKANLIAETQDLKSRASAATNNLSGANYEKAISDEISTITAKYKTLITEEEQKLKSLNR